MSGLATNPFVWWIVFILLATSFYPFVRIFGTWQAKRRFIRRQGVQLRNPQNADARFQLAQIYAQGGRWRRALEYAVEAVRVATGNPLYDGQAPYHFLVLLGNMLSRRGRWDDACETYKRALKAKSELGHTDARFGLGQALYRRGDSVGALECFREVVCENESNLEAYFRLAQAAAREGRADEVASARAGFRDVASALPRFAGRKRLRWQLAFLLFPVSRWMV